MSAPSKPNSESRMSSLTSACISFLPEPLRSSPRRISIGQLNTLLCLHLRPINVIVYDAPYSSRDERSYLRGSFTLRCFQRLSRPDVATQLCRWHDNWCNQRSVHPGPLVLRTAPFKSLSPATDRDRTVSRRSEPSSRATLIGEQPNPWDRIQPQDVTSRHRGAKPPRRCGRLGEISLLSPG